jgi:hypothetical protein
LLKAAAAGGGRGSFCQEGRKEAKVPKLGDSRVNDVLIKKNILKKRVTGVECVSL